MKPEKVEELRVEVVVVSWVRVNSNGSYYQTTS